MGKMESFLVGVLFLVSMASLVFANADPRFFGAEKNQGGEVRGNSTAVGTDSASGGNITNMNFTTEALTTKWQGYYGNVSLKSLRLGNSGINNLYSWSTSSQTNLRALVATTGSTFDFSALAAATLTTYDTALGWASTDSDTVFRTFAGGTRTLSVGGAGTISAGTANLTLIERNTTGTDISNSTKFGVGAYTDASESSSQDDYAVGVNISNGPWRSYDNSTQVNYELIVPLNGTVGAVDAALGTTYYFHIQIR